MSVPDVRVTRSVTIPSSEIRFRYSRSSGPGGQHANKTSTKVELSWNAARSDALGPRQRARVMDRLRTRLDANGTLRLSSDTHRSQLRNKQEVIERLTLLVRDGLRVSKQRVATKPTRSATERRLGAKRRRSEIKRARRRPYDD
jgi:ribosome-associated protein